MLRPAMCAGRVRLATVWRRAHQAVAIAEFGTWARVRSLALGQFGCGLYYTTSCGQLACSSALFVADRIRRAQKRCGSSQRSSIVTPKRDVDGARAGPAGLMTASRDYRAMGLNVLSRPNNPR